MTHHDLITYLETLGVSSENVFTRNGVVFLSYDEDAAVTESEVKDGASQPNAVKEDTPMNQEEFDIEMKKLKEIDGKNIKDVTNKLSLTPTSTKNIMEETHSLLDVAKSLINNPTSLTGYYSHDHKGVEQTEYTLVSSIISERSNNDKKSIEDSYQRFELQTAQIFGDSFHALQLMVRPYIFESSQTFIMQSWLDYKVDNKERASRWLDFFSGYVSATYHASIIGLKDVIPNAINTLGLVSASLSSTHQQTNNCTEMIMKRTSDEQVSRNRMHEDVDKLSSIVSRIESAVMKMECCSIPASLKNASFIKDLEAISARKMEQIDKTDDQTETTKTPISNETKQPEPKQALRISKNTEGSLNACSKGYVLSVDGLGHIVFYGYFDMKPLFTNVAISERVSMKYPLRIFEKFVDKWCCYLKLLAAKPKKIDTGTLFSLIWNCFVGECDDNVEIIDSGKEMTWDTTIDKAVSEDNPAIKLDDLIEECITAITVEYGSVKQLDKCLHPSFNPAKPK